MARGRKPKNNNGAKLGFEATLGEAWDALELIMEGDEPDVCVTITIGFRRGEKDFEEGIFCNFYIADDRIRLDIMHTTYTSRVGSDNFTEDFTELSGNTHFDSWKFGEWISKFSDVQSEPEAKLSCSRDHL